MRWTHSLRAAFIAAAGVLLTSAAGCGATPDSFDPVTGQGRSISDLFVLAMALSALVFLLVTGVLVYALIRFRGRPGDADPPQVEGHRTLEIVWTATPFALLVVLFLLSLTTMRRVERPAPSPLLIKVIGHQWWWEFQYPDLGFVTANELHVPVGTPLRLEVETADVIHAFWVTQFGWKTDAIPGKKTVMLMQVDEPGEYDGTCAEFCGLQHAWMRIRAVAAPRAEFDAWAEQQRRPAGQPQTSGAQRGQEVFLRNTCVNCHAVRGTNATALVGPDLTHIGSRATLGAGVLPNTPENMRRWVHDASAAKPGALMPRFNLSDADLQALVEYLEGLK